MANLCTFLNLFPSRTQRMTNFIRLSTALCPPAGPHEFRLGHTSYLGCHVQQKRRLDSYVESGIPGLFPNPGIPDSYTCSLVKEDLIRSYKDLSEGDAGPQRVAEATHDALR